MYSRDLIVRFFGHVRKTATCWEWMGHKLRAAPGRGRGGYGHFHIPAARMC